MATRKDQKSDTNKETGRKSEDQAQRQDREQRERDERREDGTSLGDVER